MRKRSNKQDQKEPINPFAAGFRITGRVVKGEEFRHDLSVVSSLTSKSTGEVQSCIRETRVDDFALRSMTIDCDARVTMLASALPALVKAKIITPQFAAVLHAIAL
jgi:hypothetical protein